MLPDRGFFAFTQTYDEFSGNIVANSDLNCCICLKIEICRNRNFEFSGAIDENY